MTHRRYRIETPTNVYVATHLQWGEHALKCWGRDSGGRQRVMVLPYHRVHLIEELDEVVLPRRRRPRRPVTGKRLLDGESWGARGEEDSGRKPRSRVNQRLARSPGPPLFGPARPTRRRSDDGRAIKPRRGRAGLHRG